MKKNLFFICIVIFLFAIGFLVRQSFITNPYNPLSEVAMPFTTLINKNNQIVLQKNTDVKVMNNWYASILRWVFSGIRIASNSWVSEKAFAGNEQQIIAAIHKERFDPSKPYVISGGHFSELYIRNLGIFYGDILDPCIPSTQTDWIDRQRIALQTIALDLELFRQSKREPTTYSEVSSNTYTLFNVYTRASDSLYSVLDILSKLQNDQQFIQKYPKGISCHKLQTTQSANQLIQSYKPTLQRLLRQYQHEVLDPKTFLVRKNITVSSARDGIMRSSSFYDNVIAWKTFQLAQQLNISSSPLQLDKWKQKIISTYWLPKEGIFIDQPGIKDPTYYYSADQLMAFSVGMLDINNTDDKQKLQQIVTYTHNNKLDEPFPLRYALKDQADMLYFPVKFFDPHYMGESIWSHWGVEYIKLLLALNNKQLAKKYIQKYDQNIVQFGGYPELYAANGDILHELFYKSVLHTGWVIDFEEVKALANAK